MACGICGQPMHPGLRCVDALLHRLRVQDEEIARLRAGPVPCGPSGPTVSETQALHAQMVALRAEVERLRGPGFDRRAYQREYMREYRRRKGNAEDANATG